MGSLQSQDITSYADTSVRASRCGLWSTACLATCDARATGRLCSASAPRDHRRDRILTAKFMKELKMPGTTRAWMVLLLALLLAMMGCARSPEAQKARHLARGDKYFAHAQYREAVIEYRNVLRFEPAKTEEVPIFDDSFSVLREIGRA